MEEDNETEQKDILKNCPVKMKPLTAFFKPKNVARQSSTPSSVKEKNKSEVKNIEASNSQVDEIICIEDSQDKFDQSLGIPSAQNEIKTSVKENLEQEIKKSGAQIIDTSPIDSGSTKQNNEISYEDFLKAESIDALKSTVETKVDDKLDTNVKEVAVKFDNGTDANVEQTSAANDGEMSINDVCNESVNLVPVVEVSETNAIETKSVEEVTNVQSKTLFNFFSKVSKKSPKTNEEKPLSCGKKLTVKADVHHALSDTVRPSNNPSNSFSIFDKGKRKSGHKITSPNDKETDIQTKASKAYFDDSIIIVEAPTTKPPVTSKSKLKMKKEASKSKKSLQKEINRDSKAETQESSTEKNICKEDIQEKKAVISARMDSLDSIKVPSGKKNVQATLQFSGKDMKLVKSEPEPISVKKVENTLVSPKMSPIRRKKKQKESEEMESSEVPSEDFTPRSVKHASKLPNQNIEVELEISHIAHLKDTPTSDGHTHDWTVKLQVLQPSDTNKLIEKVVFKLHETFPNSKRECKTPPYMVKESGYGGFTFPVTVTFCKGIKPRSSTFMYHLMIAANQPLEYSQKETVSICQSKLSLKSAPLKALKNSGSLKAKQLLNKAKFTKTSPQAKTIKQLKPRPLSPQYISQFGKKTNKLSPKNDKSKSNKTSRRKENKGKENRDSAKKINQDGGKENIDNSPVRRLGDIKETEAVSDSGGCRRSSRRTAAQAALAIMQAATPTSRRSDAEDSPCGSARKRGSKRSAEPGISPRASKKPKKLAPIFRGKNAAAIEEEDEEEVQIVEVVLSEEEKQRQKTRQAFLMSGVPEELRKQTVGSMTSSSCCEAPWPDRDQCHVNQDCEKKRAEVSGEMIKLREIPESSPSHQTLKILGDVSKSNLEFSTLFCEKPAIEEAAEQLLLSEISSCNPGYPVKRVFAGLKARQTLPVTKMEGNKENSSEKETTGGKKRKLESIDEESPSGSRKRRKQTGRPPTSRLSLRRSVTLTEEEDKEKANDSSGNPDVCNEPGASDKPGPAVNEDVSKSVDCVSGNDMLWTEKYAPSCMSDVLGKSSSIRKLHSWLTSWKEATDLEMRRIQRELEKRANKKKGKGSSKDKTDYSDTSDFESENGSDSDFDPEEDVCDGLCNTMLIQGPTGVGKTALVYALATQLGYKVFEVNSSDRRAGKQVLQQLQEATQSHQVSKKNLTDVFSTILSGESIKPKKEEFTEIKKPKKKQAAAAGFQSLFGGKSKATEDEKDKDEKPKEKVKKRRRKSSSDDVEVVKVEGTPSKVPLTAFKAEHAGQLQSKALDLTSCSLILFEEVDVVLEEDKGFWAAIQTFMNTTKRPIILTTTSSTFIHTFDPRADMRMETITLRPPKLLNTVTYLQLVCLAERIRTSQGDVTAIVQRHHGDLRRSLLSLQCWVQSGASACPVRAPVVVTKQHGASVNNMEDVVATTDDEDIESVKPLSSSVALLQGTGDSDNTMSEDDAFPAMRRLASRARMRAVIIDDDESSRDSVLSTSMAPKTTTSTNTNSSVTEQDSPSTCIKLVALEGSAGSKLVASEGGTKTINNFLHRGALAFQLGISEHAGIASQFLSLSSLTEQVCSSHEELISIVSQCHTQNLQLLWNNFVWFIPLPKQVVPLQSYIRFINKEQFQKPKPSRIKDRDKLFDSDEDSEEEMLTLRKKCETEYMQKIAQQNGQENDISGASNTQISEDAEINSKLKPELEKTDNSNTDNIISSISDNTNETTDCFKASEHKSKKAQFNPGSKQLISCLTSLSILSDNFSFCDSYLQLNSESDSVQNTLNSFDTVCDATVSASENDIARVDYNEDPWKFAYSHDIMACVQVGALHKSCVEIGNIRNDIAQLDSETQSQLEQQMNLPVESEQPNDVIINELSPLQESHRELYTRALKGVSSAFNPRTRREQTSGATCHTRMSTLAMDYMPSLRAIAKAEQFRQAAKTKRRFLHYFDTNHMGLKSSVVDALNASFL